MKKIVGISGSYRMNSYNLAILNYIKSNYQDIDFEILDITKLPYFNEDLESNIPVSVNYFKNMIKDANGIIISTPEYNYSIPGILKNAIDWASRDNNVFENKCIAVMSSSLSFVGGARAQVELKKLLQMLNAIIINKPEVYVSNASTKIINNVIDNQTKEIIDKCVNSFISII